MSRLFILIFLVLNHSYSFAEPSTGVSSVPTFQMHGDATLLTNLVRHGISQTNKDPSLLGSFWFHFGPQVRLGLRGSNVSFPSEGSTHLNLQMNAEVKIDFTSNAQFILEYSLDQYYSNSARNGSIANLYFQLFQNYIVALTYFSNWEGSATAASNYGFGYTKKIFGTWNWENRVGYNMVQAIGYTNYFDYKSELSQKSSNFKYGIAITGAMDSAQFSGLADTTVVLFIGSEF